MHPIGTRSTRCVCLLLVSASRWRTHPRPRVVLWSTAEVKLRTTTRGGFRSMTEATLRKATRTNRRNRRVGFIHPSRLRAGWLAGWLPMWHLEYVAFGGYSSCYCASNDALSALRLVPRFVSPARYRLHSQLVLLHSWNTMQRCFINTFQNQLLVSSDLTMHGSRRGANSWKEV